MHQTALASRPLTVQSAELQGPPVSAMMLAFTAMMYAICGRAHLHHPPTGKLGGCCTCFLHNCACTQGLTKHTGTGCHVATSLPEFSRTHREEGHSPCAQLQRQRGFALLQRKVATKLQAGTQVRVDPQLDGVPQQDAS